MSSKEEISEYLDACSREYRKLLSDYERDGLPGYICYGILEVSTEEDACPEDCLTPVYPWKMVY